MSNPNYILYSGAAPGAETSFGENAERWGVGEVNFTFDGHTTNRTRGIRVLNDEELLTGDVSLAYVGKLMDREYRDTPFFRNVLRSIWHQVNEGQQIFVVGTINDEGIVKGGTGWGAEFAKLCNKPLFVYEQNLGAWMHWTNSAFRRCETPPSITEHSFTGTGTRQLEDNGRQAIAELFARSFS